MEISGTEENDKNRSPMPLEYVSNDPLPNVVEFTPIYIICLNCTNAGLWLFSQIIGHSPINLEMLVSFKGFFFCKTRDTIGFIGYQT